MINRAVRKHSAVSGQRSAVSGQRSAVSGQRSAKGSRYANSFVEITQIKQMVSCFIQKLKAES
ncbi:MAG: hypothetical protein F6J90_01835 [Moorea sp. SIOASIH]|uniref:hypothetical protein n=1 Tax=Moorena sp. SIOASIH TaxID=2607817 RepID=UPI0013BBC130|nr:hypothetical protein [Moorena sp. SIOASIH]NEO35109.1 hypothetical protein [Moorena sp. SIOASIH]